MWSTAKRLEKCLEALREIDDIADSAGPAEENISKISAVVKEALE